MTNWGHSRVQSFPLSSVKAWPTVLKLLSTVFLCRCFSLISLKYNSNESNNIALGYMSNTREPHNIN